MSVRPFARPTLRPAARRGAIAATAVATAAVCGTLLAPAAHAAPGGDAVQLSISGRSHSALTRGSGQEVFTLTVANPADHAQDFTGLAFGDGTGPSPILGSQLTYAMTPVSAPATDVSLAAQDADAMVMFQPNGAKPGTAFSVPAHGSYSWRVAVGFRAGFPGNDDGLDLDYTTSASNASVHLDLPPALKDGKVTGVWGPAVTVRPGAGGNTWYEVEDTAGGAFDQPLRTLVYAAGARDLGLSLDVLVNGRWVPAQSDGLDQWWLPEIPKGLSGGHSHRYQLRFEVPNSRGLQKPVDVTLTVRTGLADGNTTPFIDMDIPSRLHYDPTPVGLLPGSPTPKPSSTATAKPSPVTDTGTSGTTAPAAPTVPAATPTASATAIAPVTAADAQLAHTGSNDTGLFAGLAAVLAAGGAALIAVAARRRRAAR